MAITPLPNEQDLLAKIAQGDMLTEGITKDRHGMLIIENECILDFLNSSTELRIRAGSKHG